MNNNNNNNNNNCDGFTKLPDDLVILILTKIRQQDFKFLFRCSLISKHFAALIPLMPSVSIKISPTKSSSSLKDDVADPSNSSLQDLADRFIDRKMDYLTSLRPQIQNALRFLRKFDSIRSLDVMFVTDDDDDNNNNNNKRIEGGFRYGFLPSLINWKTKFDFKLQSFVFLFAQSVSEISDQTDDVNVTVTVTPEELELRLYSSFHGVVDSIEWGNVTSCLLIHHPRLREISISGWSREGGKISLRDQQIVDLKTSLSPEDESRIAGNGGGIGVTINVKSAFVPVLRLSGTGYLMNSVSLVVVRVGRRLYQPESDGFLSDSDTDSSDDDDGEDVYDDNDILNWNFDADEQVFREAVTSILVNHKDKMKRET